MKKALFPNVLSLAVLFLVFGCGRNGTSPSASAPAKNASAVQRTLGLANSCLVHIAGTCASYPSLSNYFGADYWGMQNQGAGVYASVCAARAKDYYNFCGHSAPVTTTFTNTMAQTTVGAPAAYGHRIVSVHYAESPFNCPWNTLQLDNGLRIIAGTCTNWNVNTILSGVTLVTLAPGMKIYYTATVQGYLTAICGGSCNAIATSITLAK